MSARIYISRDAGALCVGADEVATAFCKAAETRGLDVEIVRTGSRGMYWLEPLVEVERPEGRVGYGPVQASAISTACSMPACSKARRIASALGLVEEIPWSQEPDAARPSRVAASSIRAALEDYKRAWRL